MIPHPLQRRNFLAMIAGGLLAAPVAATAQQAGNCSWIRPSPGEWPLYRVAG